MLVIVGLNYLFDLKLSHVQYITPYFKIMTTFYFGLTNIKWNLTTMVTVYGKTKLGSEMRTRARLLLQTQ